MRAAVVTAFDEPLKVGTRCRVNGRIPQDGAQPDKVQDVFHSWLKAGQHTAAAGLRRDSADRDQGVDARGAAERDAIEVEHQQPDG